MPAGVQRTGFVRCDFLQTWCHAVIGTTTNGYGWNTASNGRAECAECLLFAIAAISSCAVCKTHFKSAKGIKMWFAYL
jgi:hypothetical protein